MAGTGLRGIDVVDNGKVRRLGAVGDLYPHRRPAGIAGEADVTLGLPGQDCNLDRGVADLDAGVRTPGELAAGLWVTAAKMAKYARVGTQRTM